MATKQHFSARGFHKDFALLKSLHSRTDGSPWEVRGLWVASVLLARLAGTSGHSPQPVRDNR